MEEFFKAKVGMPFILYLLNGIKIYGVVGNVFPWGVKLDNSPDLQNHVDNKKGREVFIEDTCYVAFQNVGTFVPITFQDY